MRRRRAIFAAALALSLAALCLAQNSAPSRDGGGNYIRIEDGLIIDEDAVRTARETATHSMDTPEWRHPPGFTGDVFTFVRVIFHSEPRGRFGGGGFLGPRLGWWVDYPDADLNLSYRLQQLTSIKTDPDARVLKLTDPDLFRYPLIYMEHAGYMRLTEEEITALRKYLQSGGALFVTDFWGEHEWEGFAQQIAEVLPGRQWSELTLEHPVFHCVYDLPGPLRKLQVPTMQFWNRDHDPADPDSPLQRVYRGEGSEEMHVRALFDARGRLSVIAILNSDISDGWERESENELYFNSFSEKIAYPLGINIIVYLMTH